MEKDKDIRKITVCDKAGCETACCYGCSCCMARKGIIEEQKAEINKLSIQVLDLMARSTTITGDEELRKEKGLAEIEVRRLTLENARLRKERNDYYQQGKKLYEESNKTTELLNDYETQNRTLTKTLNKVRDENIGLRKEVRETLAMTEELAQMIDVLVEKNEQLTQGDKEIADKTKNIKAVVEQFPKS